MADEVEASNFRPRLAVNLVATIPSGQTISNAIDLSGCLLSCLLMPAAMTGTAIGFLASLDGETYNVAYDASGAPKAIAFGANRYIILAPADFAGIRHMKIYSDSAEASDRVFGLGCFGAG